MARLFVFLLTTVLFIIPVLLNGQVSVLPDEYKLLYGKQLLYEKQAYLAIDVFSGIVATEKLKKKEQSKYLPNAIYLLALAYKEEGFLKRSDSLLNILHKKYEKWEFFDDVNYLGAIVAFERKQYSKGFYLLNQISDSAFLPEIINAKLTFIDRISSEDTLKSILGRNPSDTIVAHKLVQELFHATNKSDMLLFDSLVVNYRIKRYRAWVGADREGFITNELNIAVLFPFSILNNQGRISRSNIVYDYFLGMKLGAEDLERQGVRLNFYPYDTKHDSAIIVNYLNSREFRAFDAVYGPMGSLATNEVKKYANVNKIPVFNPISQNKNFILGSDYTFLLQPSVNSCVERAAAFAIKKYGKRNVAILYDGKNQRDSVAANYYRQLIIDSGGTISVFRDISNRNSVAIVQALRGQNISLVNHLFLPLSNSDLLKASNVALDFYEVNKAVVTWENIMEIKENLAELGKKEAVIIFTERLTEPVSTNILKEFNNRFMMIGGRFPSAYAYRGYDAAVFFGWALKKFGNDLTNGLKSTGFKNGTFVLGYDYSNSNENGVVRLYHFKNGELKLIEAPVVDEK